MNPAEYFAAHAGPEVPTPVAVVIDGRLQLRTLSSILYGAPPPEPARKLRRRMAELIRQRVTMHGNVTRDDLLGGGFLAAEIDRHYHRALALSGVRRLEDAL